MERKTGVSEQLSTIIQKHFGHLIEARYPLEEIPLTNSQVELVFVLTQFSRGVPMYTSQKLERFQKALERFKEKLRHRAKQTVVN